jgi:outer membrane protein assembly factor BamA
VTSVYSEIELRYDSQRISRYYLSDAVPSTGWLAWLAVGYQAGVGTNDGRFPRLAADVQRYINLHAGHRVLVARLTFEAVGGDVGEVPFIDLPALGGKQILRGYRRDRFRDLRAGTLSVEYEYPISSVSSGFLFTEVGRVWRDREELFDTGAGDLRVGYGGGLQLHSKEAFRARLTLSSSVDGDVFFSLTFDPVFDVRSRNPLF